MISKIVLQLLEVYKARVYSGSLSDSIDAASLYSKILFKYQIPIYNLCDIEVSLLSRLSAIFEKTEGVLDKDKTKKVLFVVSEAYLVGGHTRLMENLSLMLPDNNDLLITRDCAVAVRSRLSEYFPSIIECVRHPGENSVGHIIKITENIKYYDKVILNVHPDDIFSILACGIVKKLNREVKIFFINHADHVASYGATVADFWYEISLYGRVLDNKRGIRGVPSFLGIPINKSDEMFFKPVNYPSLKKVRNFVTGASSAKYEPCNRASIFPLLRKILSMDDRFIITVVGPKLFKNYWWWKIWLQKRRLLIFKSLPYDQYMKATEDADYYIDSYPVPGGTAFVEQFLQGIPCIGLKTGFYGYTPLEIIKSNDTEHVLNLLMHPPSSSELFDLQEKIFNVHSFSVVKRRFLSSINEGLVSKNPMLDYSETFKSNKEVPHKYVRFICSRDLINVLIRIIKSWIPNQ